MLPVQECAHLYPDGRRCRRIPKRGHKLCHGHQNPRPRPGQEDEAFNRQMFAWVDHLATLPLDSLLDKLSGCLYDIAPMIERKASRRHRLAFTRATIAITGATDRLQAVLAARRARHFHSTPAVAPAPPPPAPSGQLPPLESMSPEALVAICNQLESNLSSHARSGIRK